MKMSKHSGTEKIKNIHTTGQNFGQNKKAADALTFQCNIFYSARNKLCTS